MKKLFLLLTFGLFAVACSESNIDDPQNNNPIETIKCASNEIIYTTKYGYPIELSVTTGYGGNIVAHTYENGYGKIIFDNDVQTIPSNAFKNCNSITTITLPDGVTSIGLYAFYGCTGELIVNCNIPSASSSSSGAFYNSEFTKVTIGNSVTSIGNYAFYGCSSLIEFSGKYASEDGRCLIIDGTLHSFAPAGLTNYTIPNSVTSIGGAAFRDCSSLTNVTIGNSVTSIGDYAFYNCSSLTSITIPDGVTSIGYAAFNGCSSLTSITIPDGVTSIGYAAFNGCSSLTSITIPDGVTSIGGDAFYKCSSLTSVTIPDSVTSIGGAAFRDCSSLTSITIPDSVTSIGESAFDGCSSLTSVTIGNSVTSIGDYAFDGCSSLTSVTIPDSVTSIGDWAFDYCSSLTSITIPDSVTWIGNCAFRNCSSLTSVYCKPTTPPTRGYYMFDGNASGRTIYVPTASINVYKSASGWSDYKDYIVGYDF